MARKILDAYIPFVNFIADLVGPHCEVLLHDLSDIHRSVIAIRNGYLSGRKLGCPLTDLGLELLECSAHLRQDAVVNYLSRTASGENLRSSTYFIKDEQNKLIGMLCVNILIAQDNQATRDLSANMFTRLFAAPAGAAAVPASEKVIESLDTAIENVVDSALKKIMDTYHMPVERMSIDEKTTIVQKLKDKGVFKIKGSIAKAAQTLQTSESTIYRYLSAK